MSRARPSPGFLLDLTRCVGCGSCVLACRLENALPPGVTWRRILTLNQGRAAGGPTYHLSLACHHCEDPPCVTACPSAALVKGPDGVVRLEAGHCLGCRYCEMACPFGAPAYDGPRGVMTKCHLCAHRLAESRRPACVEACPTGALGYSADTGEENHPFRPAETIPGFASPEGVRPGLLLAAPGGAIREGRLRVLRAALHVGEVREEDDDD